jgi:SAM-dependent methyltransferase
MSPPHKDDQTWLEGCPMRLRAPLLRCAHGETPPNVVLMQLLTNAADSAEAEAALARALDALQTAGSGPSAGAVPLSEALALARANPQAFATVKETLRGVEHEGGAATPEEGVTHWAAVFDRAARTSPEGSVALYALGNPDLLLAATGEVVAKMRHWGLLGTGRNVLEIGCGIGRFQAALACEVGSAVGIDISGAMIAAAQQRCIGLPNVRVLHSSGQDLSLFPDSSFDLVFAADSFPYLVQSGMSLVERHFDEAARVLKPFGHFLILNFSYRDDPDVDRADIARLASRAGFSVLRDGTRDFTLWDGLTFHLARTS